MTKKKILSFEKHDAPTISLLAAQAVFSAAWNVVTLIKNTGRGYIYLHEIFSKETGHLLVPTVALNQTAYWLDAVRVAVDCQIINFERHMLFTAPKRTWQFIEKHGPAFNAMTMTPDEERALLQQLFGKWAKIE